MPAHAMTNILRQQELEIREVIDTIHENINQQRSDLRFCLPELREVLIGLMQEHRSDTDHLANETGLANDMVLYWDLDQLVDEAHEAIQMTDIMLGNDEDLDGDVAITQAHSEAATHVPTKDTMQPRTEILMVSELDTMQPRTEVTSLSRKDTIQPRTEVTSESVKTPRQPRTEVTSLSKKDTMQPKTEATSESVQTTMQPRTEVTSLSKQDTGLPMVGVNTESKQGTMQSMRRANTAETMASSGHQAVSSIMPPAKNIQVSMGEATIWQQTSAELDAHQVLPEVARKHQAGEAGEHQSAEYQAASCIMPPTTQIQVSMVEANQAASCIMHPTTQIQVNTAESKIWQQTPAELDAQQVLPEVARKHLSAKARASSEYQAASCIKPHKAQIEVSKPEGIIRQQTSAELDAYQTAEDDLRNHELFDDMDGKPNDEDDGQLRVFKDSAHTVHPTVNSRPQGALRVEVDQIKTPNTAVCSPQGKADHNRAEDDPSDDGWSSIIGEGKAEDTQESFGRDKPMRAPRHSMAFLVTTVLITSMMIGLTPAWEYPVQEIGRPPCMAVWPLDTGVTLHTLLMEPRGKHKGNELTEEVTSLIMADHRLLPNKKQQQAAQYQYGETPAKLAVRSINMAILSEQIITHGLTSYKLQVQILKACVNQDTAYLHTDWIPDHRKAGAQVPLHHHLHLQQAHQHLQGQVRVWETKSSVERKCHETRKSGWHRLGESYLARKSGPLSGMVAPLVVSLHNSSSSSNEDDMCEKSNQSVTQKQYKGQAENVHPSATDLLMVFDLPAVQIVQVNPPNTLLGDELLGEVVNLFLAHHPNLRGTFVVLVWLSQATQSKPIPNAEQEGDRRPTDTTVKFLESKLPRVNGPPGKEKTLSTDLELNSAYLLSMVDKTNQGRHLQAVPDAPNTGPEAGPNMGKLTATALRAVLALLPEPSGKASKEATNANPALSYGSTETNNAGHTHYESLSFHVQLSRSSGQEKLHLLAMDEEELMTDLGFLHRLQVGQELSHHNMPMEAFKMVKDVGSNMHGLVKRATLSMQIILPGMTVSNLQVQISMNGESQDTAYLPTGSQWRLGSDKEAGQGSGGQDPPHHHLQGQVWEREERIGRNCQEIKNTGWHRLSPTQWIPSSLEAKRWEKQDCEHQDTHHYQLQHVQVDAQRVSDHLVQPLQHIAAQMAQSQSNDLRTFLQTGIKEEQKRKDNHLPVLTMAASQHGIITVSAVSSQQEEWDENTRPTDPTSSLWEEWEQLSSQQEDCDECTPIEDEREVASIIVIVIEIPHHHHQQVGLQVMGGGEDNEAKPRTQKETAGEENIDRMIPTSPSTRMYGEFCVERDSFRSSWGFYTAATRNLADVFICKDTDSNLQVPMYTIHEAKGSAHLVTGFMHHNPLQEEHAGDISNRDHGQLATGVTQHHHCQQVASEDLQAGGQLPDLEGTPVTADRQHQSWHGDNPKPGQGHIIHQAGDHHDTVPHCEDDWDRLVPQQPNNNSLQEVMQVCIMAGSSATHFFKTDKMRKSAEEMPSPVPLVSENCNTRLCAENTISRTSSPPPDKVISSFLAHCLTMASISSTDNTCTVVNKHIGGNYVTGRNHSVSHHSDMYPMLLSCSIILFRIDKTSFALREVLTRVDIVFIISACPWAELSKLNSNSGRTSEAVQNQRITNFLQQSCIQPGHGEGQVLLKVRQIPGSRVHPQSTVPQPGKADKVPRVTQDETFTKDTWVERCFGLKMKNNEGQEAFTILKHEMQVKLADSTMISSEKHQELDQHFQQVLHWGQQGHDDQPGQQPASPPQVEEEQIVRQDIQLHHSPAITMYCEYPSFRVCSAVANMKFSLSRPATKYMKESVLEAMRSALQVQMYTKFEAKDTANLSLDSEYHHAQHDVRAESSGSEQNLLHIHHHLQHEDNAKPRRHWLISSIRKADRDLQQRESGQQKQNLAKVYSRDDKEKYCSNQETGSAKVNLLTNYAVIVMENAILADCNNDLTWAEVESASVVVQRSMRALHSVRLAQGEASTMSLTKITVMKASKPVSNDETTIPLNTDDQANLDGHGITEQGLQQKGGGSQGLPHHPCSHQHYQHHEATAEQVSSSYRFRKFGRNHQEIMEGKHLTVLNKSDLSPAPLVAALGTNVSNFCSSEEDIGQMMYKNEVELESIIETGLEAVEAVPACEDHVQHHEQVHHLCQQVSHESPNLQEGSYKVDQRITVIKLSYLPRYMGITSRFPKSPSQSATSSRATWLGNQMLRSASASPPALNRVTRATNTTPETAVNTEMFKLQVLGGDEDTEAKHRTKVETVGEEKITTSPSISMSGVFGVMRDIFHCNVSNRGSTVCTTATQGIWEVIPFKDTDSNLQVQTSVDFKTKDTAYLSAGNMRETTHGLQQQVAGQGFSAEDPLHRHLCLQHAHQHLRDQVKVWKGGTGKHSQSENSADAIWMVASLGATLHTNISIGICEDDICQNSGNHWHLIYEYLLILKKQRTECTTDIVIVKRDPQSGSNKGIGDNVAVQRLPVCSSLAEQDDCSQVSPHLCLHLQQGVGGQEILVTGPQNQPIRCATHKERNREVSFLSSLMHKISKITDQFLDKIESIMESGITMIAAKVTGKGHKDFNPEHWLTFRKMAVQYISDVYTAVPKSTGHSPKEGTDASIYRQMESINFVLSCTVSRGSCVKKTGASLLNQEEHQGKTDILYKPAKEEFDKMRMLESQKYAHKCGINVKITVLAPLHVKGGHEIEHTLLKIFINQQDWFPYIMHDRVDSGWSLSSTYPGVETRTMAEVRGSASFQLKQQQAASRTGQVLFHGQDPLYQDHHHHQGTGVNIPVPYLSDQQHWHSIPVYKWDKQSFPHKSVGQSRMKVGSPNGTALISSKLPRSPQSGASRWAAGLEDQMSGSASANGASVKLQSSPAVLYLVTRANITTPETNVSKKMSDTLLLWGRVLHHNHLTSHVKIQASQLNLIFEICHMSSGMKCTVTVMGDRFIPPKCMVTVHQSVIICREATTTAIFTDTGVQQLNISKVIQQASYLNSGIDFWHGYSRLTRQQQGDPGELLDNQELGNHWAYGDDPALPAHILHNEPGGDPQPPSCVQGHLILCQGLQRGDEQGPVRASQDQLHQLLHRGGGGEQPHHSEVSLELGHHPHLQQPLSYEHNQRILCQGLQEEVEQGDRGLVQCDAPHTPGTGHHSPIYQHQISPTQASSIILLKLRLIHNNPEDGFHNKMVRTKVNNNVLHGFHGFSKFNLTNAVMYSDV